jgi:hypothetical protein
MRALAPEPDDRYPSMQALQSALESFARDAGLALSTMALAAFVQDLFAEELEAWRAAQREGKSLAEHLAARPAAAPLRDSEERTRTDAFASTRVRLQQRAPGRWRRVAAVAGFVVVCAVGGGLATRAWTHRGGGSRPVVAGGAHAQTSPASSAAAGNQTAIPSTTPPAPGHAPGPVAGAIAPLPVATAATRAKAKIRQAGRQARTVAPAGEAKGQPATADSRLGAWDPDSPVPP